MKKKDLAEIKKNVISKHPEDTSIQKIASAYVDLSRDSILLQPAKSLLMLDEIESSQYLSFFQKGMNGKIGNTVFDLPSDKTGLLEDLRQSELKDTSIIEELSNQIANNYQSDSNYCILFAYGVYDVPSSKRDSEDVYDYVLIMISPCPLGKPGLIFDYDKNTICDKEKDHSLSIPVHAVLYPAFDDRMADVSHVIYSAKSAKLIPEAENLLATLFNIVIPLTAEEQKYVFQQIIKAGYNNIVPFEVVQNVYNRISELQMSGEYAEKNVEFSMDEIAKIVIEAGDATDAQQTLIRQEADNNKGKSIAAINIAPKAINIESSQATIKVNLEEIGDVSVREIDGIKYYLVPASNSTVEGLIIENK